MGTRKSFRISETGVTNMGRNIGLICVGGTGSPTNVQVYAMSPHSMEYGVWSVDAFSLKLQTGLTNVPRKLTQ